MQCIAQCTAGITQVALTLVVALALILIFVLVLILASAALKSQGRSFGFA